MTDHAYGIDPGVNRSALATGDERFKLVRLNWIPSNEKRTWPTVYRIALEKPIIYPGIPDKDLNDLMDLRETYGWLRRELECVQMITPTAPEWKGQVKKPIHHGRLWEIMTNEERALFPPGTLQAIEKGEAGGSYKGETHNLLDAAGLLFYAGGRIVRGGGPRR